MMPLIGESLDFRFYFLNTRTVMLLKDNMNKLYKPDGDINYKFSKYCND